MPRPGLVVAEIDDPLPRCQMTSHVEKRLGLHRKRFAVAVSSPGSEAHGKQHLIGSDLRAQGREIASFETSQTGGTMSWGPQPYKGHVYVSDMNSGLWIVRLEPRPMVP